MIKRVFPYLLGALLGIFLCGVLLFITAQPRGKPITLLPAPTPAPIMVDVGGAVNRPGVYALASGSRVQDALTLAGGCTDLADLANLNQAVRVKDGQKIFVPLMVSVNTDAQQDPSQPTLSHSSQIEYPIDLNLATLEELDSLPGIGATRAQQIIDYREAHGSFGSIDELLDLPGIGETTFAQLKNLIIVESLP